MVGAQAIAHTYPPLRYHLTPQQTEAIFHHVARNNLMSEPNSPDAEASAQDNESNTVVYEVIITANSTTRRYVTTAAESPPTIQLLSRLAYLARFGPRPPGI